MTQLDVDVQISGSDSSDEASPAEEDETDRRFAGRDFNPTQAPKGYDQRAVYRAGLSTQAGHVVGLGFKQRVDEQGFWAKARKPVFLTDDEGSEGGRAAVGSDSENEYEMGSFVVQDDEDLGFEDGTL
jgi:ATP-dependent DNA helicase MPH1